MSNRPLGIGDFLIELKEATFKGDVPGHEFHGNQYDAGGGSSGGGSESSGASDSGSSGDVSFSKVRNYGGHKEMTADKGDYISTGRRVHIIEGNKNSYMLRTRKYSSSGGSDWTTHKTGLPIKEAKSEAVKLLNDDSVWK